ncbi:hypothetical protein GA0061101_13158 [Rhizobium lusitanum]|jgi:hypothetical protein|uniref:Uncharacterized protein n=1 Tax=Rhizobium lusitanum TaxID=293958 RepID=A0A1C3XC98_9HYPH|nr:hypothetical protein GA0061101_13158 [Rhizobium lusitanum]
MPARYVIARVGTIACAEVNADYTWRPEPSAIFPVLEQLAHQKVSPILSAEPVGVPHPVKNCIWRKQPPASRALLNERLVTPGNVIALEIAHRPPSV